VKPLERHLQASVLAHLKKLRATDPSLIYRKRHGGPMGVAGDPDITGLWRGVHFEIELKAPGENPSPLQLARLAEWGRARAVVGVVRSLADLEQFLTKVHPKTSHF